MAGSKLVGVGATYKVIAMSKSARVLRVRASWDADAKVWVAESDDIAGLVTEAATIEALIAKLHVLVPELIEENQQADGPIEVPFELLWRTHQVANLTN